MSSLWHVGLAFITFWLKKTFWSILKEFNSIFSDFRFQDEGPRKTWAPAINLAGGELLHAGHQHWWEAGGETWFKFPNYPSKDIFQVQSFLLAAISPFLASLLSQVTDLSPGFVPHWILFPGRQLLPLHLPPLLLLLPRLLLDRLPSYWETSWKRGAGSCFHPWHQQPRKQKWIKIQRFQTRSRSPE